MVILVETAAGFGQAVPSIMRIHLSSSHFSSVFFPAKSCPPAAFLREKLAQRVVVQRLVLFLAVLIGPFLFSSALAEEPAASPAPAAATAEAPTEEENASPDLDLPVAEGQDVLGLRIPHYNERGEMMMLVNAEVARRLDDEQIEMEAMRIDFWNEERQQYALVMPKSRYLIEARALAGNDGALIQREDFRIEGQNLEFDLEKQVGVMLGEVTMTIQNVQTLTETETETE